MITNGKIFIIDDDASVRKSLCWIIEPTGLRCEAYASARDFLNDAKIDSPSCLVLDMELPEMSGLNLLAEMKSLPALRMPTIVLTGRGSIATAVQAMRSGANDFLEKPAHPDLLLEKIQQLLSVDQAHRKTIAHDLHVAQLRDQLTTREAQVLELLCEGKSSKEIAAVLNISVKTVSIHRWHIMKKMQVSSATELVQLVLRRQAA